MYRKKSKPYKQVKRISPPEGVYPRQSTGMTPLYFVGRMFPGRGKVRYQASFDAEALLYAIRASVKDSVDGKRVRLKLFTVEDDDSLRVAFAGIQEWKGGGRSKSSRWERDFDEFNSDDDYEEGGEDGEDGGEEE